MPTTRELILSALQARLQPLAALTLRDEVLPERIPAAGLIILRDGQPGEPEVTLSPLRYHYQHQQEVNTYIASHAAALHLAHRAEGQVGVQRTLRLQARYETQAFHRNHWRPALLRALSELDEFTGGGFAAVLSIPDDMLDDLDG